MTEVTYPVLTSYTPKNFDASTLPGYNKRHHWKYLWVVHTLLLTHLRTKSKFDSPVSLNSEILKKLFGNKYYTMILNSLRGGGIIKRYNYRPGEHSFRYKLNKSALLNGIERIEVERSTIRRKIFMYRDQALRDVLRDPVKQHEFQNLTTIEIDVNQAVEYVNANYVKGTPKHIARMVSIYEVDKLKDTTLANDITLLDWMFKIDRSGRWHTPISHLAKDLRQFLRTFDGQRFMEIDQACSQLTYCHKYLLERQIGKTSKMHHIGEEEERGEGKEERLTNKQKEKENFSLDSLRGGVTFPSYVVQIDTTWREAIFEGRAYKLLMEGLQFKGSRDEFKERFFAELFYNRYQDKLTYMEKAFKHYFPNEFKRLRLTKRALGNKELAVQVQRYESAFWHRWVGSGMREEFRTIGFATIHDSVLVPEAQADQVKQMIIERAVKFFNPNDTDQPLVPTFRIKRHDETTN